MVIVQLSLRADERDVYEFFSKAGKVRCKFLKFEVPFVSNLFIFQYCIIIWYLINVALCFV